MSGLPFDATLDIVAQGKNKHEEGTIWAPLGIDRHHNDIYPRDAPPLKRAETLMPGEVVDF